MECRPSLNDTQECTYKTWITSKYSHQRHFTSFILRISLFYENVTAAAWRISSEFVKYCDYTFIDSPALRCFEIRYDKRLLKINKATSCRHHDKVGEKPVKIRTCTRYRDLCFLFEIRKGLSALLEKPFCAVNNWRVAHQSLCSGFAI